MNVQLPIAVSSLPGPTGEGVDNLPVPGDNIPGVPLPPDELNGKTLCTSHLKPVAHGPIAFVWKCSSRSGEGI